MIKRVNIKLIRLVFDNPKPEGLIERILRLSTQENDIVLDFFSGSGTTLAASLKMRRKYLGIEQMEYVENVTVKRLNFAIKGEEGGISKSVNWTVGDFIYLEPAKLNQNSIDEILKSKSTKELKTIWEKMKKKGFISYKINPQDIHENISEFEKLSFEDQKKFLIEVLDKNHLYVNYSEIDDKDYGISEEDKKLNKIFYSNKS